MLQPWPVITDEDKAAVMQALDDASKTMKYTLNHPAMKGLEADVAAYIGVRHCLTANSGTAALHMAVAAAGIKPGDEVITSAYTFLASATCVLHHNAIPVFADVQPHSFNIDPRSIEAQITPRTRAIIPVHIFGLPADMDEIMALAARHNLVVIEDACQAFGATYRGRKAGAIGQSGAFSLESSKLLPSTTEGGLLVTHSSDIAARAALLRLFGEGEVPGDQPREYNAMTMGWNYRMSYMAAAMTRSQLRRFDAWQKVRLDNSAALSRRLARIPGVEPPKVPADRTHGFFMYPIVLRPEALGLDVDVADFTTIVQKALNAEGMPAGRWQTRPVPGQALFQQRIGYGDGCPWACARAREDIAYRAEDYPVTNDLIARTLLLKKSTGTTAPNTPELMDRFADAIEKVIIENRDAVVAKARALKGA
jgi:dTDP-4-amino-4,6-dideoxygalactose transaminase